MKIVLDVSEYQTPYQLDHLLRNGPDEIVGVYIKATQDISYRDSLATAFAKVCIDHKTPFGYYDFLGNDQAVLQADFFRAFTRNLPAPQLIPMIDAEPPYDKFALGVEHFAAALGTSAVLYASLSNMSQYSGITLPKWAAAYPGRDITEADCDDLRNQGYVLWQFNRVYAGFSQDVSVLLGDLDTLKL